MMRPTVNINGTSRESLIRAAAKCVQKLTDARDILCQCAPHGRDYQGAQPGDLERDRAEHKRRLGVLNDLIDAYTEDARFLQEG